MTPDAAKASYARQIGAKGETVLLRRQGVADVSARAFVTDNYTAFDTAGDTIQSGKRVAVVLADDVAVGGFVLPFRERQDRVAWGAGSVDYVQRVSTRRVAGVVIAFELELEGS